MVLPVITKVFETVIFNQLTEYFTINNFFSSQLVWVQEECIY